MRRQRSRCGLCASSCSANARTARSIRPRETLLVARSDPAGRIRELREAIRHHEEQYYIHDDPEISDEQFDHLLHELEELEADHPDLVTLDSPTQRVAGRPTEGFATAEHLTPMLSLD